MSQCTAARTPKSFCKMRQIFCSHHFFGKPPKKRAYVGIPLPSVRWGKPRFLPRFLKTWNSVLAVFRASYIWKDHKEIHSLSTSSDAHLDCGRNLSPLRVTRKEFCPATYLLLCRIHTFWENLYFWRDIRDLCFLEEYLWIFCWDFYFIHICVSVG